MFDRLPRGERHSEAAREREPGRERQYAPGKQPLTARMGDGAHGAFRPELARVTRSMTELAIALGRRNAANVAAAAAELQRALVAATRAVEHVRSSGPTHELATLQRVLDDLQRRSHALLERAAATEPSSGPRALPEAIRGELESATGTSLAAVRVHSDAHGQRVAASHGARAVAIGDDIYVADGQLDVASAEGRELLAHEVAHVVQSRAHARVDTMEAAELEADDFAARFRTRGGAMSWSPATSVSAGTPMRAPAAQQRDGQNASLDYQLTIAKQQDQNINAAGYLHLHFKEIFAGALGFLRSQAIGTGHEQVTFQGSATSFLGAVFAALDGTDTMAKLTRLRHWLAPADLFAIVDRARPIFEPADAIGGHPDDALDYGKGPKGPALYRGAVGSAIASELERRVVESMKRMSARFVAVTARKRATNQMIVDTDLVNSHPLDVHVGRAMVAHCSVQTGALDVAPGAGVTYRKVKRLEWMGKRGGPWNSVRSIDPADANVEEMAAAVLGKSTEAYRLIRIGPYFLVPAEVAARVPEARSAITYDPAQHAPTRLAFGPLAAAAEVAEAEHAISTARGASPSVPLQQRWQRIQEQLDAIGEIVRPYQLDGLLAPVRARHTAHKSDLATLAGRDAIVRAGLFDHQHRLLARVAAEIGPLIQSKSSAIGVALGRLVEIANLSHLAETGSAAFDRLKDSQRHEVLDVLEQHLGAASTQIELIRRVHRSSAAATRSKLVSGIDFQQRADELGGQLAAVRSKLLHKRLTSDDAATAQLLMQRIDALRFEATLVAEVGQLATIADVFQQLGDQKWMQLTEHMTYTTGRLAMHRVVALELRGTLEVVHKDWLAIQAAANLHAEQLARSSTTDAALKAAAKFQPALDAIRGKLHALASDRRVRDFLIAAHDEIDDAQLRATIIQIAVLVGVAALSFGAGVVAEGVAVGMGTTALAGQFVGLLAESLTFSVISAALSDESILAAFASNFLGNLATFGALRLTKAQLAGSVIGKTLSRAKQGARVGTLQLWAVKIADVTAPMLVAAGVQFAQAEAESLIRTGRTLSMDELKASAVQGIAMMIGALVSHKLLAGPLDDAKAWGAGHGARRAQLARLKQLSAQVEASGDKTQAIELLHGARIHIEAELAKWNELSRLSSDELASRGLSKQVVDTMGKRASSHRTALDLMEGDTLPAQLALDALVPGHIYAGDPADVGRVVDSYRAKGYTIDKLPDGYRVTRKDRTSIKLVERPGHDVVDAALNNASPTDRRALERVLALDAVHGRRLIREYGDELKTYLRTNPLTTLGELESVLVKQRAQIDHTVPGLYMGIDVNTPPAGWTFNTDGPLVEHGTTTNVVRTRVRGPNGADGIFVRAYDPVTKHLELRMAFLKRNGEDSALPNMVPKQGSSPEMITGKGTPTVQYVTLHQMRLLGVAMGDVGGGAGVQKIHLSDIQNVETIVHLHYLRQTIGGDLSRLVEFTASVKYAETTAIQSGYERAGVAVLTKGQESPIREVLEFQEQGNWKRVAENNKILAKYGFFRDTVMRWGFDIDFPTRPKP